MEKSRGPEAPAPTGLTPERPRHPLRLPLQSRWKWGSSQILRQEAGAQEISPRGQRGAQLSLWVSLPLRPCRSGVAPALEGFETLAQWAGRGARLGDHHPAWGQGSQSVFPGRCQGEGSAVTEVTVRSTASPTAA